MSESFYYKLVFPPMSPKEWFEENSQNFAEPNLHIKDVTVLEIIPCDPYDIGKARRSCEVTEDWVGGITTGKGKELYASAGGSVSTKDGILDVDLTIDPSGAGRAVSMTGYPLGEISVSIQDGEVYDVCEGKVALGRAFVDLCAALTKAFDSEIGVFDYSPSFGESETTPMLHRLVAEKGSNIESLKFLGLERVNYRSMRSLRSSQKLAAAIKNSKSARSESVGKRGIFVSYPAEEWAHYPWDVDSKRIG